MNLLDSIKSFCADHRSWLVWASRIIVGMVFIMSGLVKAIDLWGLVYKIEEYFSVWGVSAPRSLVEMLSLGLSVAEFMLGLMLIVGAYRRTVVYVLLAMMAFMLPLTVYIYFYSPVSDCGCFGDFIHLSNGATLLKNVILIVPIIYLLSNNKKVSGLYHPYVQWLAGAVGVCYVVFIALYGLLVQPMVDFRSFPTGSALLKEETLDSDEESEFEFIYERDGITQTFPVTALPDSSWTFVSRKMISGSENDEYLPTELYITDNGEDVTEDVLATSGEQILITLPMYERADVSYTYIINELEEIMNARDGSLIEIAAVTGKELDEWRDLSMALYPIYYGEPTMLKELARGVMAAVYIKDGVVVWKRSLGSINTYMIEDAEYSDDILAAFVPMGGHALGVLSIAVFGMLFLLWLVASIPSMQKHFNKKSKHEESCDVN